MAIQHNKAWTVALAAFVIHNIEEAVAISNGWTIKHFPSLDLPSGIATVFIVTVAALTIVVAVLAFAVRGSPARSYLWLKCFLALMLLNVIWHVGVSLYAQAPAPGVYSAVLLVLPLYGYLLRNMSGS